ncbi:MAG: hypothetical protein E7265_05760 [Lachnospiraceae bacterium]|nr:hypothetical protein [Lachnospiraceae bacterium]
MIKILGMIFVVCSTTMMGLAYSNRLNERLCDIRKIQKSVVLLRGEIRYKGSMLAEAFVSVGTKSDRTISEFYISLGNEIRNNTVKSMSDMVHDCIVYIDKTNLRETDVAHFAEFIGNLGYLDKEMQMSHIQLFLEQFENNKEDSLEQIKMNSKLYKYMGVAIGIMVCLLIG